MVLPSSTPHPSHLLTSPPPFTMLPVCFCINLRRRPDRRESVISQFADLPLRVEFVDAVDGRSASVLSSLPSDCSVSASEYGCGQSHRLCWQRLLDSEQPCALVLEDDVRIDPATLLPALTTALTTPHSFDLLHLGYNWHTTHLTLSPDLSLGQATATHAYLLTRAAASTLLSSYDPTREAIDIHLFHHSSLRRLLLTPPVAFQADGGKDSDIAEGRRTKLTEALADDWLNVRHSSGMSREEFMQYSVRAERSGQELMARE